MIGEILLQQRLNVLFLNFLPLHFGDLIHFKIFSPYNGNLCTKLCGDDHSTLDNQGPGVMEIRIAIVCVVTDPEWLCGRTLVCEAELRFAFAWMMSGRPTCNNYMPIQCTPLLI